MPEGHVIHRLADALTADFGGRPVRVSSPQGRFADEASHLDGHDLVTAEAWGKHLFVSFDVPLPSVVQIHLGLIGKLMIGPDRAPWGQVRLRISDGTTAADLRGPQTCRLITVEQQALEIAKLGPDPIRPDADPERGWSRLHASSRPIAALLMDQQVAAGVGNIYRAEVLYRHRIDPYLPGNQVPHEIWRAIWDDLVVLMADGVAMGRIDTVTADHTPEAMDRPPRIDRHGGEVYVYRRAGLPCHVCGSEVRTEPLAGRNLYWCPTCQHR
ncbi:Fpg/Nei family DNA glycosylase [Aestuariimicrobium kwangyangense]|uniref:Fpg/Nei family DNA glycosylase n=1 Tax=Aestuariimicrobium kwangyangense TaxID=396389 RepID=UPI0003B3A0C3|nr:DNA-formamidopyrimidine glycosylase family protein [Aestuariimicrobium kwangyangense]